MTPVEPVVIEEGSRLVVWAKDQPQYIPLPTVIDPQGMVISEWEPTAEELYALLNGGRIRLCVHTFDPKLGLEPGHHLQPVSLQVLEPECGFGERKKES